MANVNCFERRYQHENEDFSGLKIAILVDDGFEQTDLAATRKALGPSRCRNARRIAQGPMGPRLELPRVGGRVAGRCGLDQARSHDFDALIVPGGVPAAEALRMQPDAIRLLAVGFVQAFLAAAKPVAVISRGPWTVIEAGTEWVEQEVVVDCNLVSSRMIDVFGRARRQA